MKLLLQWIHVYRLVFLSFSTLFFRSPSIGEKRILFYIILVKHELLHNDLTQTMPTLQPECYLMFVQLQHSERQNAIQNMRLYYSKPFILKQELLAKLQIVQSMKKQKKYAKCGRIINWRKPETKPSLYYKARNGVFVSHFNNFIWILFLIWHVEMSYTCFCNVNSYLRSFVLYVWENDHKRT